MGLFVPSPLIMMVLLVFVKLAYKVLNVGTVVKNEYKDNPGGNVTNQRWVRLLIKLRRSRASILSLNAVLLEM